MRRIFYLSMAFIFAQVVHSAESPDARLTNVTPHALNEGPQESFILTLPSGLVMPHLELDLVVGFAFQGPSMVVLDPQSNNTKRRLLGQQGRADLRASLGLHDRFEFGLTLPVVYQQESAYAGFGLPPPPDASGIADPRMYGTWQHLNQSLFHFNWASTIYLTVPLGNEKNYTSRGAFGSALRTALSRAYGDALLGVSVGIDYQTKRIIVDQNDGTRIRFGAGGEFLVRTQQTDHRVSLEIDAYAPLDEQRSTQFGAALGLGYDFSLYEHWQVGAHLYSALTESFGLPVYQGLLNIGYRYLHIRRPPRCINEFSYLHDDRCDPPDTDEDGIFDPDDRCPKDPEDHDGFEDADGCPDPDNDKDGYLDGDDKCPLQPEDKDGFEDDDGCPDVDNDKDGIKDEADKCPMDAETKNGFDDEDGCPEPDDDQDQIPNAYDRCPSDAEDKDNFEDKDGCPDPDNDQDGILDPDDLCPNEPENLNGVRDNDGCPDQILAVKTEKEIVITDKILFIHGQVIPRKVSRKILSAVKDILVANPSMYVQIEGHTDAYGGQDFNRYLSQARAQAVLDAIVRLSGGDNTLRARLTALGFGKDKPAASNETKEGRARNRRVIFRIMSQ